MQISKTWYPTLKMCTVISILPSGNSALTEGKLDTITKFPVTTEARVDRSQRVDLCGQSYTV